MPLLVRAKHARGGLLVGDLQADMSIVNVLHDDRPAVAGGSCCG